MEERIERLLQEEQAKRDLLAQKIGKKVETVAIGWNIRSDRSFDGFGPPTATGSPRARFVSVDENERNEEIEKRERVPPKAIAKAVGAGRREALRRTQLKAQVNHCNEEVSRSTEQMRNIAALFSLPAILDETI